MPHSSVLNDGKTPRAVILDLDDTLYPERQYAISGVAAVAGFLAHRIDLGIRLDKEELVAQLVELLEESRTELFDRMLARLGVHSPPLLTTLVHVYRTHRPSLTLFSDVMPFFARLRNEGIRTGIVTDGKATMQHRKIESLGLVQQVNAVICSDDLQPGCGKPSTVPFEVALCHLRISPETAVYIGDDLSKDFIAPRQLGMATIRLDRMLPHPLQPRTDFPANHQADKCFHNLNEVAAWLFDHRGN